MNYRSIKSLLAGALLLLMSCGQDYKFSIPGNTDEHNAVAAYNKKADIIFIVDDSRSMKYHQQTLAKSIPGMIEKMLSTGLDLRMAVTSTSLGEGYWGGRFIGQPKYLTSQDPDVANTLATRLQLGSGGRDVERGLESLFGVLHPNYQNGEGSFFLRPDALLVIIELTTEDDALSDKPIAELTARLDALKPPFANGERSWVFNLIATLEPNSSTCTTNPDNNYTEQAKKLIELANASGGIKESVCSPTLTSAVSNIKARIVQILSEFFLERVPDLATLKVFMNDVEAPRSSVNGWDYIPSKNSVRFYGAWLPSADAKIRIEYQPARPD